MKKTNVWLLAGLGAVITEVPVCAMVHHFGHIGGDGADFWGRVSLATELPGAVVGERLFGVTSPMVSVFGFFSGAAELFLVWVALTFLLKQFRHVSAEPTAPAKAGGTPGLQSDASGPARLR